ncbi:MAG TPA: TolC family protein, partial [Candidatus Aquilonibacter sp.]|nr:TolC family protein [Candidatus Aquilonibacter sp.]
MLDRRYARALAAVLALAPVVPSVAIAQQGQAPVTAPSPLPMPTGSATPVPYPAYGTPAPDVAAQQRHAGIPASVTLLQAIDIAVAQSPAFASQRAQYRAIAARYGAEQGALFPNISANGTITRSYGSSNTASNGGAGNNTSGSTVVTSEGAHVTLNQLIYDGGRVIAGIRTAKEADIAGRDTLVRELQTLAFNVATAYYNVLQANATVDADSLVVRQFETQENAISAQIRAGAAARSDLAAAQSQTANARGQLVAAQSTAISAQSTFATTLGLDADTAVNPQVLDKSPGQVKINSYPAALKIALNLRPDYLAAIHTVESSSENLRFAKLARFPSLNADASTGTQRTLIQAPPISTPFQSTSSIGATISIPIYDQGLTNYNVAVAASQLDQANAALLATKLSVQSDVRSALATVISARAALVQGQAELSSATVNLQASQARYHVGAATITDVVTAQALYAQAQRDYVNVLYAERVAEERYTYAL